MPMSGLLLAGQKQENLNFGHDMCLRSCVRDIDVIWRFLPSMFASELVRSSTYIVIDLTYVSFIRDNIHHSVTRSATHMTPLLTDRVDRPSKARLQINHMTV